MSGAQSTPRRHVPAFETPTPKQKQLGLAVTDFELALEEAQRKYLTACGWEYTCDAPGSLWLWVKEWDGRRWSGGTDLAIRLQAGMWR